MVRINSPNLRKVLEILTDTADTNTCIVSFGPSSVAVQLAFIHLSHDFERNCYFLGCNRKTAERLEYHFMIIC